MNVKQVGLAWLLASGALFANTASADELIINGGFETAGVDEYDIQGWSVAEGWSIEDVGLITGSVLLENDGITNASGRNTVGVASGVNYALLDAFSLSNQALLQTFSTGAASSATLSFSMFANNQSAAGTAINSAGLDYTTGGLFEPNQHVRVDLLKGTFAGANVFSTNAGDIAQTFYLGGSNGYSMIGGDVANPYINYSFDISSLLTSGGTYTLRYASVANEGQLQMGIDNVSLLVTPVPEADTYAMLLVGLGLMGFVMRRRNAV